MKIGLFNFPVRFTMIPPIDLGYLSAYLKKRGHEVFVRDFNVELPLPNDCDTAFWEKEENQKELFNKNKSLVEK